MFHSRYNASGPRDLAGINERWETGEREKERETKTAATATATTRRVTFKTVLRNLLDLVYFRRYRCHARSVTVALNQQRHELSRGLRSRKAIYVTRENVNDSRSSSSMLSCSLGQFANSNTIVSIFSKKSRIYSVLYSSKKMVIIFVL